VEAVSVPVKVILEPHHLTEDEIIQACQLCIDGGASYIKTSTGWTPSGATLENIALITSYTKGRIGVKASGGIRDLDTLLAMYRLGARRFGINAEASARIIQACQNLPDGLIKVV
jgi:deoxyribose-phosphate aldolase